MSLFSFDIKESNRVLSHELSEFGRYLFDRRTEGTVVEDTISLLSEAIDDTLETEEDMTKYGIHTEKDAQDFVSEVFGRMYEDSPEMSQNEWSHVQDALSDLPEFNSLVSSVRKDADLSAMASSHVVDLFRDEIVEILRQSREHQKQQEDDQPKGGDHQTKGKGNAPGDGGGGDGNGQGDGKEGQGQSDAPFQPSKDLKDKMLSKALDLEDITKDMKDMKDTVSGIGSVSGEVKGTNEDRSKLIKDLVNNPMLRNLFRMIGRLKSVMNSLPAYEFNEEQREQVVTIGRGSYTDLLSSEQTLLADDFTTDIFLDRWIRRSQVKWRKRGKTKVGAGPMIVLLDESSSMGGSRNTMASTFAGALATLCYDEGRDFYSIGFNRSITHESKIAKNGCSWDRCKMSAMEVLMNIAQRGVFGGTSFDPPLRRAIELNGQISKADILLLTDGAAHISPDVLKQLEKNKKDNGLRLFTILVGGAQSNAVSSMSDGVAQVSSLEDATSLAELAKIMKQSLRR